uniref:Uncharacterized protein n=1 Tax=Coccidioides posadasii RMSCC 3488 TaxID=454284 RepID=A0A0J6FD90_COCPO|nr:hypothetical protein CPAG_03570 [Coccidioides posadasii RMSCC 3488]
MGGDLALGVPDPSLGSSILINGPGSFNTRRAALWTLALMPPNLARTSGQNYHTAESARNQKRVLIICHLLIGLTNVSQKLLVVGSGIRTQSKLAHANTASIGIPPIQDESTDGQFQTISPDSV